MTSFIRTPLANADTLLSPVGVRIREVWLHCNSVGFHWVCYRGVIIVNGQLLFLHNDLVETWYISKAPGMEWIITGKNKFKYTVIFRKESTLASDFTTGSIWLTQQIKSIFLHWTSCQTKNNWLLIANDATELRSEVDSAAELWRRAI